MTNHAKEDWRAWIKERRRFAKHETLGLAEDIEALNDHIAKLIELGPKDTAGYLNLKALQVINRLQLDVQLVMNYIDRNSPK